MRSLIIVEWEPKYHRIRWNSKIISIARAVNFYLLVMDIHCSEERMHCEFALDSIFSYNVQKSEDALILEAFNTILRSKT